MHKEAFDYRLSPELLVPLFRPLGDVVFLDSAWSGGDAGRYSYLMAAPAVQITGGRDRCVIRDTRAGREGFRESPQDVLEICQRLIADAAAPPGEARPFEGGLVGFVGYDYGAEFHGITPARSGELGLPHVWMGWYGWLLVWDHHAERAWITVRDTRPVCHHLPEAPVRWVRAPVDKLLAEARQLIAMGARGADPAESERRQRRRESSEPWSAAQHVVEGWPAAISSSFSREEFMGAVQRVREYILAGDIFQANISQRFSASTEEDPWSAYTRLRENNPAPYAAFIETQTFALLSASPEMFLAVGAGGAVETRPIKGTRPRGADAAQDDELAAQLLASGKDRAENLMIVDLLRNDLSRVCVAGSVHVAELCALESWASVHHLVSTVRGRLRAGVPLTTLLQATFPGGSITGAPKERAMQIIAEIEGAERGVYCGAIGYFSPGGGLLLNVAIRTLVFSQGRAVFSAGGGIVLQSDPELEYDETLAKGRGMLTAITSVNPVP